MAAEWLITSLAVGIVVNTCVLCDVINLSVVWIPLTFFRLYLSVRMNMF